MNPLEMIVERTAEDQKFFVDRMRKELLRYGYSVVLTSWLHSLPAKALGKMMVAAE